MTDNKATFVTVEIRGPSGELLQTIKVPTDSPIPCSIAVKNAITQRFGKMP